MLLSYNNFPLTPKRGIKSNNEVKYEISLNFSII